MTICQRCQRETAQISDRYTLACLLCGHVEYEQPKESGPGPMTKSEIAELSVTMPPDALQELIARRGVASRGRMAAAAVHSG